MELKTPADYRPTPKAGSTDDYRCFLLDPGLTEPELVSGVNIIPGNPNIVHHVIVSQVPASQVARAQALDAADAGDGWTCFGAPGSEASEVAISTSRIGSAPGPRAVASA